MLKDNDGSAQVAELTVKNPEEGSDKKVSDSKESLQSTIDTIDSKIAEISSKIKEQKENLD